jgi:hypothetical protein
MGHFALHLEHPARTELVAVSQLLIGALGDLDGAWRGVGLHAPGGVDGAAPQVVDELGPADHAGYDRAGIDADPHLPGRRVSPAQLAASGCIASAISAIASAWSARGSGMPPATM